MMKRTPIWAVMALLLAACPAPTGTTQPGTQQRPPPIPEEAFQAKAVPYARTVTPTWPREATRHQIVISGGWQTDERFAWLIADGTKLVAVYRIGTREDLSDLLAKIAQSAVYTTPGGFEDKSSWVIAGAIKVPDPPPPPEPGGFPRDYVIRVFTAAYRGGQISQPITMPSGQTVQQP